LAGELKWYIVHTYSGHENKVKIAIEKMVEIENIKDQIAQVKIPTMEVAVMKDGRKKITKKKFMPGYILIEMVMNEENEYKIRKMPSVTGFVGSKRPQALSDDELKNIFTEMVASDIEKKAPRVRYDIGESVRIVDGPFANFTGFVDEVYPDKGRLRVKVEIFGRSTPVELDYLQVGKV
jgi:transcriptional antiterminator NusG